MTVRIEKPAVNLREELADLRKPTGIAGEAMLRAETPQEQQALIGVGRRNFIINGLAQVSQRGDYTSAVSMVNNTYYLDRWKAYVSGGTHTIQQVSTNQPSALSGSKSIKISCTNGGTIAVGNSQRVEDYEFFVGKELTVSGWVKSNNPNARFMVSDGSVWTAVGDAHSGNGQWEFITGSTTLSSSATRLTLSARIATSSSSAVSVVAGDYIEFTAVQLELGKVATPFEHRSYGEELALCQRYYYRQTQTAVDENIGIASAFDADDAYAILRFPVTMRSSPAFDSSAASTMKLVGDNTSYTATVVNAFNLTPHSCAFQLRNSGITIGNSYMARFSSTVSSSNFIEFDAEL